ATGVSVGQFPSAGGNNSITYQTVMYANNTHDDNSAGGAAGTYNGTNTLIKVADAGFVSPGAPDENYALKAGSPAINAGNGSNATVDITNSARVGVPDLGAYEFGTSSPPPPSPPPPPPPPAVPARDS